MRINIYYKIMLPAFTIYLALIFLNSQLGWPNSFVMDLPVLAGYVVVLALAVVWGIREKELEQ